MSITGIATNRLRGVEIYRYRLYIKPLKKGFIIPLLFHFMVFWCLVFGTNHTAVFQHLIDRMGFKYSKQSNF